MGTPPRREDWARWIESGGVRMVGDENVGFAFVRA